YDALPNDDTWIVAYCECPRAAAESAVRRLRQLGYKNTAVLYEGYAGWSALGYPIAAGNVQ
ncbi:MAG: rhodanese-like domain-containing protein, partial [Pseudomonadota bacterium]